MPVGSFLALLDDITLQSKIAIAKASGVVTDDVALNANMVTGIPRERELPIVRSIALGSLANKLGLSAGALAISAFAPAWVIPALLMLGGAYLCYEGVEKVGRVFGPKHEGHGETPPPMDPETYRQHEKAIVRGAIITDVVLSAEITALTLGGLNVAAPLLDQGGVLLATGLAMTVGVYGLVAAIVKIDDGALLLMKRKSEGAADRMLHAAGKAVLQIVPRLMKALSYVGTGAMFVVGGGIFVHQIPALHEAVEAAVQAIGAAPSLAPVIEHVLPFLADTASGIAVGVASFAAVEGATFLYKSARRLTGRKAAAKERESVSAAVTSKPQPAPRPVIEPVHGPDAPLHPSETMKDAAEAVVPQEPEAPDNKRPSPPPCSITL